MISMFVIIGGIVIGVILGIFLATGVTLYFVAKTNAIGETKGEAKDFSQNTKVIFQDGNIWRSLD